MISQSSNRLPPPTRPEPSHGFPPTEKGREALERMRRLLDEVVLPMVAEHEHEHGTAAPPVEADGRLSDSRAELKHAVQQESAQAGVYVPQLPEEYGGLELGLVDLFYIQEEVFLHGLDGAEWVLSWDGGAEPPDSVLERGVEGRLPRRLPGRQDQCLQRGQRGVGRLRLPGDDKRGPP